jgi:hypothetical protein
VICDFASRLVGDAPVFPNLLVRVSLSRRRAATSSIGAHGHASERARFIGGANLPKRGIREIFRLSPGSSAELLVQFLNLPHAQCRLIKCSIEILYFVWPSPHSAKERQVRSLSANEIGVVHVLNALHFIRERIVEPMRLHRRPLWAYRKKTGQVTKASRHMRLWTSFSGRVSSLAGGSSLPIRWRFYLSGKRGDRCLVPAPNKSERAGVRVGCGTLTGLLAAPSPHVARPSVGTAKTARGRIY